MDGEAITVALGSCSGPDCLKEVIPKVGTRLKVYSALKTLCEQSYDRYQVCVTRTVCMVIHVYCIYRGKRQWKCLQHQLVQVQ